MRSPIFGNRKRLYNIFLHFALVALATEVIVLVKQNRLLKQSVVSAPELIKSNDYFYLNDLEALQASSEPDIGVAPKLIFIFTTTCQFCKENIDFWNQIVAQIEDHNISIIGISLDSKLKTSAYLKEHSMKFPVFCTTDRKEFSKKNKILGVPMTLILDDTEQVKNVWTGLLSSEKIMEIVQVASERQDYSNKH